MYYVNSYGDVQKPGYITALHFKMLTLLMLWYQTACISAHGSKKHFLLSNLGHKVRACNIWTVEGIGQA